jgi:hypothetical protein
MWKSGDVVQFDAPEGSIVLLPLVRVGNASLDELLMVLGCGAASS